jgi:hypothetical protein
MRTCHKVLDMLLPNSEYVMRGETYDSITFISGQTITEEQFEAGFAQYDAWKAQQDAAKAAAKSALLERLGITADEAKLLLA